MTYMTRLTGVVLIASAVGVLAACGSGDDADVAATPQDMVLSAGEFPDGYDVQNVAKDQILDLAKRAAAAGSGAVTPASCKQSSAVPADLSADELGVSIAQQGAVATITDVVTASDRDIASFRAAVTGPCATIKKKVSSGPLKGLTATVVTTVLDLPDAVQGKDALVYRQVNTSKVSGKKVVTQTLSGVAKVNGYLVRVEYAPLSAGKQVDRTAFDESFARAVDKVAEKA